jgi:hypothetical protein
MYRKQISQDKDRCPRVRFPEKGPAERRAKTPNGLMAFGCDMEQGSPRCRSSGGNKNEASLAPCCPEDSVGRTVRGLIPCQTRGFRPNPGDQIGSGSSLSIGRRATPPSSGLPMPTVRRDRAVMHGDEGSMGHGEGRGIRWIDGGVRRPMPIEISASVIFDLMLPSAAAPQGASGVQLQVGRPQLCR